MQKSAKFIRLRFFDERNKTTTEHWVYDSYVDKHIKSVLTNRRLFEVMHRNLVVPQELKRGSLDIGCMTVTVLAELYDIRWYGEGTHETVLEHLNYCWHECLKYTVGIPMSTRQTYLGLSVPFNRKMLKGYRYNTAEEYRNCEC